MSKSFKDSLKALEADIHFANTLASNYANDHDDTYLQMRLSYSPAGRFFLFLVQWCDCHLAGSLGMLRILIYKGYKDKKTMSIYTRKATLKEFYGVIFPSLLQLHKGINDVDERKQKQICVIKYKAKDVKNKGKLSEIDVEGEEECGICMKINTKVVFPNCIHSMCIKCFNEWNRRSQSCPFCRDSLKRVKSGDLWIYITKSDILDLTSINNKNLKTLFMYIEKLPLIVTDPIYSSHTIK